MVKYKMVELNEVILTGWVSSPPVIKREANYILMILNVGVPHSRFNAATSQWERRSDFIQVEVWGKLAEQLESGGICKGTAVLIRGRLRQVQGKSRDGKGYSYVVVRAFRVVIMGRVQQDGGGVAAGEYYNNNRGNDVGSNHEDEFVEEVDDLDDVFGDGDL